MRSLLTQCRMSFRSLRWMSENPDTRNLYRNRKTVELIGMPLHYGQPIVGTDLAPHQIRQAGIVSVIEKMGLSVVDDGDLDLEFGSVQSTIQPRRSLETGAALKLLRETVARAMRNNHVPVVLGGDHSLAMGSITGVLDVHPDACVFWIDAHADINTPSSSHSGNIHGMPVSGLIPGVYDWSKVPGFSWVDPKLDPARICMIGLRDVDPEEKEILAASGVLAYTMEDVDDMGIMAIMDEAIKKVNPTHDRPIHVSFDVDGLDPTVAPSTGTRVLGGLTFREGRYILEQLFRTGLIASMDVVEVNPLMNSHATAFSTLTHSKMPMNGTVAVAMELIACALGRSLRYGHGHQ